MVDYIAIAAIIIIVGSAIFYIVRAKKRGEKCVGCPHSKQCGSSKCSSGKCSCGSNDAASGKN